MTSKIVRIYKDKPVANFYALFHQEKHAWISEITLLRKNDGGTMLKASYTRHEEVALKIPKDVLNVFWMYLDNGKGFVPLPRK